jgi:hypothetical protein
MRFVALALSWLLVALPVHAAEARKYAVLSLIGDVMLISEWVPSTGSRTDPNQKTFIPMSDGVFDKSALLSANNALKGADPSIEPVLLFARERTLYEAQNRMLDADGKTVDLLDHVRALMKGTNATHLVLLTKYRSQARLPMHDQTVGSGMLEGVGFYIDSSMKTILTETNEPGAGLLAPFAYFRIELIDLASGKVLAEKRIVAASTVSIASSTASHAWNALSGAEKVRVIRQLIDEETTKAIPALLKDAS